jgi:hypothetical protein
MYHIIEFTEDLKLDLERSSAHPLEKVLLRRGVKRCATIRPRVIETEAGPVEAADLFFDDGTTARTVPFEKFRFAD